ncbi:cation-transporting P-type ATPase [Thiomicrospira sp. ALE5]|uniref:cation-transporting P-type ATPase n=1 Tax=Thiomicrospira sp. ALE5 TaxID=748650 RepID=UPI0008E1CE32|nr:cation-transporting P-type ATPase [Thiomicrospira sp. ALE5]SFR51811.1 Ca2+-transporting ATPase [Thiomicrospira sp. ALE5]
MTESTQTAISKQPDDNLSNWHANKADKALAHFNSSEQGLSSEQVADRLAEFGPNRIETSQRSGPLVRLLRQFNNILIYILIAAAVGTAFLEHWVDTFVILAVVFINASIGYVQEGKAEQALDAIRNMLSPQAVVLRNGQRQTVEADQLVSGDIVLLQAGDKVPADLRLIDTRSLRIEEAVLTGESVPVEKRTEPVATSASLGDRLSLAYSGTLVSFGRGRGVVIATGQQTEIGRISAMLSSVETISTPLLRQTAEFGRILSIIIIFLSALIFAFGYWVRDYAAAEMFLAAVSLAVSTIPEGLPAIMTITLAIGVQKMAKRNAIIRRLPAVETLGAVTTICSDKTGTLTRNEMTVQALVTADHEYQLTGVGYAPQGSIELAGQMLEQDQLEPALAMGLKGALLCNDSWLVEKEDDWQVNGDPTEGALLAAAMKVGLDPQTEAGLCPRTDLIPFESDHKFMATLHHDHEQQGYIFIKGAPEKILAMCQQQRTQQGDVPIDVDFWHQAMEKLAERGQRVLAIAVKPVPASQLELGFNDVQDGAILLNLFGIIDPPREEAIEAVAECHQAGIRVKMITGDHAATAKAIGLQLGIGDGQTAVTGQEIEQMDDQTLQEVVTRVDIFARTSPEHKLRLVAALQAQGHVTAMTGDGVNDAPALKRADVGISMGRKGTEASKEASEMVLADDNFASIARAVREGRTVYNNIRKSILHMLPTNAGQSLTIIFAILLAHQLPLTPVQVLWVNMVTSVTLAMALAFEPTEPGVMRRHPRRPDMPLLSGLMLWRIPFVALLLWAGTFGHFVYMDMQGVMDEYARTVAINTLVAGQIFYLFNLRYIDQHVFSMDGLFGSKAMWIAVGTLVVLQLAFTYAPFMNTLFGTTPIAAEDWIRILMFGLLVFILVEMEKWVRRRYFTAT